MKLASRIKYILLPFIFIGLSLPATLSYVMIKNTLVSNLSDQLLNDARWVSREIYQQSRETEGLIWLFLNSREAIAYLQNQSSNTSLSSHDYGLYSNFSLAKKSSPFLGKITIFRPNGSVVFNFDTVDPFSSPVPEQQTTVLLDQISSLTENSFDPSKLSSGFFIQPVGPDANRLVVSMPFSATLMMSDLAFAELSDLYVVQLVNSSDLFVTAQKMLAEYYQGGVSMAIDSHLMQSVTTAPSHLEPVIDLSDGIKLTIAQPFGNVSLSMTPDYVAEQLAPIRNSIILAMVVLLVLLYTSLRAVIHIQIIKPITKLANQVKDSFGGGELQLKPSSRQDEVSELNNNYLELFSHVSQLANFDSLTGLLNRASFAHALNRAILDTTRKSMKVALLYIDLDNFKKVNDSYGHTEGDALLVAFGLKLKEAIRPFDELHAMSSERGVARLAGDEFAILLTNLPNIEAADAVAKRIMTIFEDGFMVGDTNHDVQASIGISIAPDDGVNGETLIRNADAAMYAAKQQGKDGYRFYSSEIEAALLTKHAIEDGLKSALNNDLFYLVYMPIFGCSDLSILGVEVLLRTNDPLLEGYSPSDFIAVAEQSGLIKRIDLFVIEEALKSFATLSEEAQFEGFIAINISARELHNDTFASEVGSLINQYDVDPSRIEMEITETYLEPNDLGLVQTLNDLKSLGVRLSLDDFGTGYTAFSQLATFPVDVLKIDRSFVSQIHESWTEKRLTVDIIVDLARLYEMSIVAEGVEDQQQLEYVQSLGVECVQGFFLSKPLAIDAFIALLITKEHGNALA